jgi:hypothetical protein
MRWPITLVFPALLLVAGQPAAGGEKQPPARQLQINLVMFEGDPLGSREARTLKVVAEPRLIVLENRPFTFMSGGESPVNDGDSVEFVPFGRAITGKASAVKGGKVRLDITLSETSPAEGTEERLQFHTRSTRTIATVRLGEVVKLRWGKGGSDKQAWVELTVEEVKR